MPDFGFSKLLLIAIVALIVIGPERLPKVARMAGLLLGRLQRYVNDVKADIGREMELEEMKRLRDQFQDAAREVETSVHTELHSTEGDLNCALAGEPHPAPEQASLFAEQPAATTTTPAAPGHEQSKA